jgi:hypothetical protein
MKDMDGKSKIEKLKMELPPEKLAELVESAKTAGAVEKTDTSAAFWAEVDEEIARIRGLQNN